MEQFTKVKNDPFFQELDWEKLYKKKILPPFISNTKDARDDTKINKKVSDYMNELKKGLKTKRVQSKTPDWD